MTDPISLLGERHLTAIGLMIVRVSMLEGVLLDLATRLMQIHILDALAVFEHQQFSREVLTVKTLVDIHLGTRPELGELTTTLSQASTIGDRRNTVVHGYWAFGEDGGPLAVRYKSPGKIERHRIPMPCEEIELIADDAKRAKDTLVEQINRLFPDAVPVP